MIRKTSILGGSLALALLAAGVTGAVVLPAAPATAQPSLADAKSAIDAAKARGDAGEQADGYVGVRSGDPGVAAAAAAINAGRRQAYAEAAAKAGVSIDAAAGAAAQQLIARTPPGQYYRDASGGWVRK